MHLIFFKFLISVIISNGSGGSGEVCFASGPQRCDDPVSGDQGQERHGERDLPDVLPPHGEGGRQEGWHNLNPIIVHIDF